MKKFLIIFIALFSIASFAQKKQMVIISNKYDFQKVKNSYNINNILKAILISNNFQVYFDDETLPIEVAENRCNVLTGILVNKSNMFVTKVTLKLNDCQNNTVFETAEVKSREKDIQAAYIEALKLLSPELKKFKPALMTTKPVAVETKPAVVEKQEVVVEKSSEIETKTVIKYQFIEIANGFAIMDATPKVVLQIYKTTNPNIFIADKFGVKGIFTKQGNKGVFEYYLNDKLVVEEFLF
ncbi:MAG: hypothetical protein V4666_09345 [Bacteroidota bacterium]